MKMKYVLPLVIFLALAIFLMVGLNRDPREVPSPLIGKPAPSSLCRDSMTRIKSCLRKTCWVRFGC